MRYLCIDPAYPAGTPPESLLTRTIYSGVRVVVRPNLWPYVGHCLELGVDVQLVIARESGDPQQYADWATSDWMLLRVSWVIGNEPDTVSPSSWTMTPAEYAVLWQQASVLKAPRWIAGMASGDVSVARRYLQPDAAGLVVHIYTLTPSQAVARMAEYATLGRRLWVGETYPAEGYKLSDYRWTVPVNDFCFSNAMVDGMGLYA